MFPQQLWTKLQKHLLKKSPQKEDLPADPPGEGKPAEEESAPAPVHATQRATEQWSSLSGLGKLFEKGLPGSVDLLNLMVL